MKLRRGCGCPLIILAAANLFFVIGAIIRLAAGPGESAIQPGTSTYVLGLFLFLANLFVAAFMTLLAFRGLPTAQSGTDEQAGSADLESGGSESDDEPPGSDA